MKWTQVNYLGNIAQQVPNQLQRQGRQLALVELAHRPQQLEYAPALLLYENWQIGSLQSEVDEDANHVDDEVQICRV